MEFRSPPINITLFSLTNPKLNSSYTTTNNHLTLTLSPSTSGRRWTPTPTDSSPPPVVFPHPQLKCESIETGPVYTQFGSKPEFSQSPGSAGEVYEAQWVPPNPVIRKREISGTAKMKKKKTKKFCVEEDEEEIEREMEILSGFIEARILAHQEQLQRRFTAAIDKMDKDRKEREDAWRAADVEAYRAHASARAREQALASAREAVIVSYLEKMTGQKMDLPPVIGPIPRPGSQARLGVWEDDVTPRHSFLYSDEGDVDCEKTRKNEMLEALLEFKERNAKPNQFNKMNDYDHKQDEEEDYDDA
ncbi:hypothetical protein V2J09_010073 [Rumex salicifolius]